MSAPALFSPADGHFVAGEMTRGPWDARAQHGGAPAALLMRGFEQLPGPPELRLARVTYEFLRPVPLGALELSAEVARPGRRVSLLEATLAAEGVEVVRARALQVLGAQTRGESPAVEPPPPGAAGARASDLRAPFSPMFSPDAVEVRFVEGAFLEPGPATAWFRLRVPVLGGEAPSPLQRLAAAADFGNGVSAPVSWDDHLFINPDLTLYVERPPVGEWIGLESRTRIPAGGVGMSESVLYDERGRVGRALQSLLVAPR
jgi:hypothetical protein